MRTCKEIAGGLEKAENDFEARRHIVDLLECQVTLAIEEGQKAAYVRCLADEGELSIDSLMVLKLLVAGVLAYLIGSFPTGVILGKLWSGIDVRQVGSTHTGGMNVARSVSIGAGILTIFVDATKGIIAVTIGQALTHSLWSVTVTGVMATAGHCWPIYTGFHGGMGLTTLGVIFFYLQPLAVLVLVPLWFVLYIVIRHSPRTTMALMLTVPLLLWLLGEPLAIIVLGLLAGGVVLIKHIPDFNRVYD